MPACPPRSAGNLGARSHSRLPSISGAHNLTGPRRVDIDVCRRDGFDETLHEGLFRVDRLDAIWPAADSIRADDLFGRNPAVDGEVLPGAVGLMPFCWSA